MRPRIVPHNRRPQAERRRKWETEMRVVLSTYGSRGDVEPLTALAVALRALGAEVRVCAPPDEDFAKLLARVSVPLVLAGQSGRRGDGATVAARLLLDYLPVGRCAVPR
jgi:vancomycin aglycone glucosyltransferase